MTFTIQSPFHVDDDVAPLKPASADDDAVDDDVPSTSTTTWPH